MSSATTRAAAGVLVLALGASCAAPLERVNRATFRFNQELDRWLVGPVTRQYVRWVPDPLRGTIGNLFDHWSTPHVALNDFLQGKGREGMEDLGRFFVNSTAGLGGLGDVASAQGMPGRDEDFGQTLAVWGVPHGPYLVLPLLGPNTLRSVWRFPVQSLTSPTNYLEDGDLVLFARVADFLDRRSRAEGALRAREETAVDSYAFTKEAFLQRREFLARDGETEEEEAEEELDSLLEELEG